ncbi:hypothetical protein V6N11_030971 [Hibiscus sabdariffa]|uniref:Uncharacterized protein n=1 Tax=Hibiscus sabdariffa TaxID=183260 RepID=A0ABR2NRY2_9ROSI
MFERLCKLMTIASYGPSHPSYEEESESKNGMKGELNTFRGESSDSSRENEPKEREIGNAFSTYGFSRGPLGVLRNQVCQRKTMTLSLNMLPKNKESHSICHLFPRFRIEFVQDRSECFFESRCRSLIKQSQAEKQKALHQGWGSLLRLRSNSTSRSERGSTSRNQERKASGSSLDLVFCPHQGAAKLIARGATLLSLAGSECDRSDSLVVSQIQLVFCLSKAKISFVVAELEESKAFVVHQIKKALAQALPSYYEARESERAKNAI